VSSRTSIDFRSTRLLGTHHRNLSISSILGRWPNPHIRCRMRLPIYSASRFQIYAPTRCRHSGAGVLFPDREQRQPSRTVTIDSRTNSKSEVLAMKDETDRRRQLELRCDMPQAQKHRLGIFPPSLSSLYLATTHNIIVVNRL
jgi:hypothetical protein